MPGILNCPRRSFESFKGRHYQEIGAYRQAGPRLLRSLPEIEE
jgi:hypothetical protein